MEKTTIENTGAPSTKTENTNAGEEHDASVSNNQEADYKLMDSLYSAAADGDIEKVKKHDKQLDRIVTPNGNTILHIYIVSLPPETAKPNKSDQKITDPKKKSEDGSETHPPEAKFVTKVLEMCPNLLQKANKEGETPLHFAARYGHGDIVKELIEECKKPHNKDQENGVEPTRSMLIKETNKEAKDTALHEAIRYNHIDVVNTLINAAPDLTYKANGYGETPLYLAAERGYTRIVEKILRTWESPADRGPMNRTALHAAVIRKDEKMTNKLLNLINKEDEQGRLPLHYAAYLGYDVIVDVLLDKDPRTAYKADNEEKTALHLAAGNGKASAVDKLISKCPSCCELVDNKGRNALHLALASENYETVDLVLKNPLLGNLVNQKDDKGNTPLLQLAASGSFIKSFIRHSRVDKLAFNRDNQNAADIILAKDLIVESQESFLDGLGMIKTNRCRRIIVPKEEISRERKVNRVSILGFRKENVKAKDECDEIIDKIKEAKEPHLVVATLIAENVKAKEECDEIIDEIKEARESHLVAATLIATVTFAAGFTLPGGYIGKDGPNEGAAILTRSAAFQAFVIFDTTAFVLSCFAVLIRLSMAWKKDKTQLYEQISIELYFTFYAMTAMVFAFVTGIYAVLYPNKNLAITACVIGCVFGVVIYLVLIAELLSNMLSNMSVLTPTEMVSNMSHMSNMLKKKKPQDNFYDE